MDAERRQREILFVASYVATMVTGGLVAFTAALDDGVDVKTRAVLYFCGVLCSFGIYSSVRWALFLSHDDTTSHRQLTALEIALDRLERVVHAHQAASVGNKK